MLRHYILSFYTCSFKGKSINNLHITKCNFVKNLNFAGKYTSDYSKKCVIILIRMKYFNFVTGKIKRKPTGYPVAIESLFGWIFSVPNGTITMISNFVSLNTG